MYVYFSLNYLQTKNYCKYITFIIYALQTDIKVGKQPCIRLCSIFPFFRHITNRLCTQRSSLESFNPDTISKGCACWGGMDSNISKNSDKKGGKVNGRVVILFIRCSA